MDGLFVIGGIVFILACLLFVCTLNGNNEQVNLDFDKLNMREITIEAKDGLNIAVEFYSPKVEGKYPAILLLHMLGKDKASWNKLIPELLDNGFVVYSADLRGHGRSVRMKNGKEVFYQNMNENDWNKIPEDVIDLVDFISQDKFVDSEQIGIAGASIGANAAIICASRYQNKVKTVIALSPGLNYRGLEILEPAKNLKVPILMVAGSGDKYAYESSNQLNEVVKTIHDLLIYDNKEHGTNLLIYSEGLQKKVVNWLNEYLKK